MSVPSGRHRRPNWGIAPSPRRGRLIKLLLTRLTLVRRALVRGALLQFSSAPKALWFARDTVSKYQS